MNQTSGVKSEVKNAWDASMPNMATDTDKAFKCSDNMGLNQSRETVLILLSLAINNNIMN